MLKREVQLTESFCDMIRTSKNSEQAEKICELMEEICIANNIRGLKGMWIMQQLNTAFEETYPYNGEDE